MTLNKPICGPEWIGTIRLLRDTESAPGHGELWFRHEKASEKRGIGASDGHNAKISE